MLKENTLSQYARTFNKECFPAWQNNAYYNILFLSYTQTYFNDLLKSRGYVFLNEVYEKLGIPKTRMGHVVGWIYDEKHPVGDNFVDFGIYEERNIRAVNGAEDFVLDFNVDGQIYEKVFY